MTLMLDYGLQFSAKAYAEIEKENLKRLAFIDQLTGVPNRSACYQRVEEIKAGEIKDYVIVFIDINFLKITNDRWGHDKGDELIRTAGELLSKYFIGGDFFGRWGGDEFIAIHFGTLAETEAIMNRISAEMDEINRSHRFDFNMSFAWGYGESTAQHPLDPDQAITVADEAMYVKKKADHAERQN
jgi:diguanylate cyclase (GGDEF)-like protein